MPAYCLAILRDRVVRSGREALAQFLNSVPYERPAANAAASTRFWSWRLWTYQFPKSIAIAITAMNVSAATATITSTLPCSSGIRSYSAIVQSHAASRVPVGAFSSRMVDDPLRLTSIRRNPVILKIEYGLTPISTVTGSPTCGVALGMQSLT